MTKGLNLRAIADRWGCSIDQVRGLVAAGELKAVNIGLGKQRARWIVPLSEVEAFERRRSNSKPEPKRRRPALKPTRQWV